MTSRAAQPGPAPRGLSDERRSDRPHRDEGYDRYDDRMPRDDGYDRAPRDDRYDERPRRDGQYADTVDDRPAPGRRRTGRGPVRKVLTGLVVLLAVWLIATGAAVITNAITP